MKIAHAALLLALAAPVLTPAWAQDWQEYRDSAMGFGASFPGTPNVSDTNLKLEDGTAAPAKLYYLRQGASEFKIMVADFSKAALQGDAAINEAVKTLSATGKVTVNIDARVNRNYGRQLGVTAPDGSQTVAAIFFANGKLYQIEGITHPAEDANSSNAARFQQSLTFQGGFGGRGRRGGP
jgi:hypothetical protein